ncbi:MAG: TolC family protein [Alphaproteobacteria bacterium]|nr:TolC family protein [Alphaproteobacteria bacterium]
MKKIILIFIGIILSFDARAAMRIGLEDTVAKILAASQDIRKAELNVQKSEAVYRAARSGRLPQVNATASIMNNINLDGPGKARYVSIPNLPVIDNTGNEIGFVPTGIGGFRVPDNIGIAGVELVQPIYTFGRIGHGLDAARSAIRIAESSAELARREMRVAAVQIYYGAKMAENIQKIMTASLESTRRNQRALTAGGGRANKANLLRISTDIAIKESQVSEARFNYESAMRMLKIMADIDDDVVVILSDEIPSAFIRAGDARIESYPEWDIYQEAHNASRSAMKSKRADWLPTLAATASYNYFMLHTDMDVWNGTREQNASVGLAIQIPIFDGGRARFQATQDAREADRAMQDLDKAKKLRGNELTDAIERHNFGIENMKIQTRALDLARQTYSMSANRFASGQTSAVELSDVESSLVQLEIALLNTRVQTAIAAENIRKLVGEK